MVLAAAKGLMGTLTAPLDLLDDLLLFLRVPALAEVAVGVMGTVRRREEGGIEELSTAGANTTSGTSDNSQIDGA